jgi:hypothetical protein
MIHAEMCRRMSYSEFVEWQIMKLEHWADAGASETPGAAASKGADMFRALAATHNAKLKHSKPS